jgi:hypothetical protein
MASLEMLEVYNIHKGDTEMDTVKVFMPAVEKYFTAGKKGLSITQANARKNDNTNKAERILTKFNQPIYHTLLTVIGANVTREEIRAGTLIPEDFKELYDVAGLYADNAIFGQAISLFKKTQTVIQQLSGEAIVNLFNIEYEKLTASHPTRDRAVLGTVEEFMDLDSIEQMVGRLMPDVLNQIDSSVIFNGLINESYAAVLGKQLTKKESIIKNITSAAREVLLEQRDTNFGLVVKRAVIAYTPEEVAELTALQQTLYASYTSYQGQVNGVKKIIKDKVREVESQYAEKYNTELHAYNEAAQRATASFNQALAQAEIIRNRALTELAGLKVITG